MEIPSFFAWLFFFLFSCLLFVLFTKALRFPFTNPNQKLEKETKNPTKPIVASSTISLITLPEDLLINEILPRLPVKSLVRFQSVSKPWKTLITDHKFITNHLNRTTGSSHRPSHRNKLVAVKHRRRRFPPAHAVALLSSETNGLVATLAIPLETDLFESLKIVGSANGLLCLAHHECRSDPGLPTILWNPSLNKLRALPKSVFGENRPYQERVARVIHGFGYHHAIDDHKIIRVLHVYDKLDVLCFRAEVFSLGRGSWRAVESGLIIGHKMFEASCVAANGVLHWIAFGIGSLRDSEFVLCFDLGLEEFRRLELPCAAGGFSSRFGLCANKLAERGGNKLCLLSYTQHGWDKWVQVWDFDEKIHAWERKVSVGPFVGIARPLGCGWSGEIYLEDKNGRLVLYNPNTGEVRKIKPVWAELYSYEAHLYVESLVWKD